MFGTRDLFSKSEKINEIADRRLKFYVDQLLTLTNANDTLKLASEQDNSRKVYEDFVENMLQEASQIFYLKRLYQQAKQLSQIIAYIWRWIDVDGNPKQEVAKQLKEYFIRPTEDNTDIGGNLEKLLAANPRKDNQNINAGEAQLLREVFPDYKEDKKLIFPIFDELERGDEVVGLGYSLKVDINSFQGNLSDTDVNNPYLFVHTIPYPPRPQLGEATVTPNELEDWIENRIPGEFYADNTYIPTTSS